MKETWDSERDPLAALRDGDPEPFEAFVVSATPAFLAFFGRLGASRAEAEDLVQEVFLKLFRTAPSYTQRGRFAAYAFRVARNGWIDRVRKRGAEAEGLGMPVASGGADEGRTSAIERAPATGTEEPGSGLARREEAARLRAALARLPEHHRLVFELGVLQEMPYESIADTLEIPVGTVKSRMFHAVRKLRAALGEDVA
ncbi:MAG: RNA polymerase sigma factor [bacterium]|nr:RNA polymerase sigma factor [bacterium]